MPIKNSMINAGMVFTDERGGINYQKVAGKIAEKLVTGIEN